MFAFELVFTFLSLLSPLLSPLLFSLQEEQQVRSYQTPTYSGTACNACTAVHCTQLYIILTLHCTQLFLQHNQCQVKLSLRILLLYLKDF